MKLNPFILAVDAPPIPEAQGWRSLYSGSLGPMMDLSQAVPGTPPPEEMLIKLGEAARSGENSRYGPILGDAALRSAYAQEMSATYGAPVPENAIAITAGCNQAFVVAMLALAKTGDNVILPAPWYFNHAMSLQMLGIDAKILAAHAEQCFVPDPAEAEALIDIRTRAIILVTPNNPTGAIYPPEIIARFAELARRRGIALVLDETYRDFLPSGGSKPHDLFTDPDWGETLIQLYSFSKAHAIPGHRLGAITAAPEVIVEITKILDSVQICPARPAQRVVAWAIEAMRPWREAQRAELLLRAQACRAAFAGLDGWRLDSVGAYFAYVAHPFPGLPARVVAQRLAVQSGVLGLPGSYFGIGQDTHLRLAFANVGVVVLAGLSERLKALKSH